MVESHMLGYHTNTFPPAQHPSAEYTDAKKKIVRFGRGEGKSMEEDSGWSEPLVKDSGIDTGLSSSSQTICEEWCKVLVTIVTYIWLPVIVSHHLTPLTSSPAAGLHR